LLKAFVPQLPFLDRMLVVFVLCVTIMLLVPAKTEERSQISLELEPGIFSTSAGFKLTALAITLILSVIYAAWW